MIMWNWGLAICDMIPQIQKHFYCVYRILNVEVTSNSIIIYYSITGPSVGEVATLWGLVPNVLVGW